MLDMVAALLDIIVQTQIPIFISARMEHILTNLIRQLALSVPLLSIKRIWDQVFAICALMGSPLQQPWAFFVLVFEL